MIRSLSQKKYGEPEGHAGFSLIEVLLALAVFSIGLLAVAGMQTSSVTRNSSSRMNTMAVEYASDYMERLLALGTDKADLEDPLDYAALDDDGAWHTPDEFAGLDYDEDGVDDITTHPAFDDIFALSWRVEDLDADDNLGNMPDGTPVYKANPTGGPGLIKRITVRVRWGKGLKANWENSSDKMIELTSLKSASI